MNIKIYLLTISLTLFTSCFSMEKDDPQNDTEEKYNNYQKKKVEIFKDMRENPDKSYLLAENQSGQKYILLAQKQKPKSILTYTRDNMTHIMLVAHVLFWSWLHRDSIKQHPIALSLSLFAAGSYFTYIVYTHLKKKRTSIDNIQRVTTPIDEKEIAEYNRKCLVKVDNHFTLENLPLPDTEQYQDEQTIAQFNSLLENLRELIRYGVVTFDNDNKLLYTHTDRTTNIFDNDDKLLYTHTDQTKSIDASDILSLANGINTCSEIMADGFDLPLFVRYLTIDDSLGIFSALEKLTLLSAEQVSHDFLYKAEKLKYFKLQYSPGAIIGNSCFDCPFKNLETIILNNNDMGYICAHCLLQNLPLLKYLDVSHNKLGWFPPSLKSSTSLTYLDISHNQLYAFPETGTVEENGKIMHSKYVYSPEAFAHLVNLTYLNLSHNKLELLPEQITTLSSLTQLEVSNNELTSIPHNIDQMRSLQVLDLTNNPIVTDPVRRWWSLPKGLKNQQNPRMTFNRTLPAIEKG